MGINHLCDRQKNIAFVVWDGTVTGKEWRRHVHDLVTDPDWPAINRFIVDLRTVSDTGSIGDEEVVQVIAIFSNNPALVSGKRNAIVATEEFRRARRFETSIARFGITSVVFNNLDTACIFLGINPDDTWRTLEQLRSRLRLHSDG